MDRLAGVIWIGSALLAGGMHYWFKRKPLTAAFAAFCALAVQFALMILALALIYMALGGSFIVESRDSFIKEWMGVGVAASIVMFWFWLLRQSKQAT